MKTKFFFAGRLILLLWCALSTTRSFSQQIANSLTASNGTFIGFLEYKPVDYSANPNTKYPLIIFLHGIGERGNGTTDLLRVAANAIPRYISVGHPMRFQNPSTGQWETFLVLSPQLSYAYGWWPEFYAEEMIKYAKQNLRIDTNRIYLTGLSLGGGGTWKYASASYSNARSLAAIAPVCGTCDWSNMCGSIAAANLPVWAFHANDDGIVGVGCTTGAIWNINACSPAVPPIQTIYPNGNHYIWDRSYDTAHNWHNPNIYEWFLTKSRSTSMPGPNTPPIARAGTDQSITLPTSSVTLNGSASFDPDGSVTAHSWTKIGGPAQYNITTPNTASTGVTNLAQGVYSFQLTVTDNLGATSKDTILVTVNGAVPSPNQAPVALAGPDQSMTLPTNNTYLFGSASYDPDGVVTAYAWTQVGGPSTATITTLSVSNVNVSNMVAGVYSFRLQVTDNMGGTDDDTLSITVNSPNIPPVANAGIDQSIQLPTNSVTLNGTGSSDIDGAIAAYAWTKIAGPAQYTIVSGSSASTTVNNLVAGTYSFRLLVTDNRGGTDDDTVIVTVAPAPPPPNMPPAANAGSDQSIQLPANSVTLSGSASSDPDGTISSYAWSKIAGPAQYNIVNANSVSTTVDNLAAGTYSFRLVVTDNNGASVADTVMVTVLPAPPPPNVAPVANAGTDQSIQLPTSSVNLDGAASSDADGTIIAYAWSKIAGPAQYNISNAGSAATSVSNLVAGTYSFRLVVTDNNGATDDDTIVITVAPAANIAPTANAGSDQSIQLPANSVTLNGSASSDADGTITGYTWTKISGPVQYNIVNANSVSTTVDNLVAGTYLFRLVVTDNNGATDADTVMVDVGAAPPPPNVAPVANAGIDQSIQLPTSSITLDGSASVDTDGTITGYAWSKISGPSQYNISNSGNASTSVTNLAAGTYSFRLVVTDNNGATDDDTVVITVAPAPPPPNMPPTANAGGDQSIQLPVNNVMLNGSASSDADGTIITYAWTKVAGPAQYNIVSAGSVSTTVDNLVAGTYSFRLQVTDNNGASDADTVTVTVTPAPPPPNIPPVANAGNDQSIQLPTASVTLNGSASTDADGTIAGFTWSKIAGPAQFNIVNANNVSTQVSNLVAGTYSFRLVVTDNSGATDDDTVVITVAPAPPPPNVVPVANAGNDQSIQLPVNIVLLDGTSSVDIDGSIVSYAWTKIAGPSQYTIANAGNASTSVNNLVAGTYSFRLVVTDNRGATDDDTVVITVAAAPPPQNQLPVAHAGNDQSIQLPTNSVTLSGAASNDPDGTITAYAWTKIAGPAQYNIANAGNVSTSVTNLVAGAYSFRLVVTDNNGATDADTVVINVTPAPNQSPVANAGNDTTVHVPGGSATLNATASYDPDGNIVSYSWNRISGPAGVTIVNATTASATVVGMSAGDYVFELRVTDNNGATATDRVTVHAVQAPNQRPVANAGRDTTLAVPARSAWLSGMASRDIDGNIVRYEWKQVSGPAASAIQYTNAPFTMVNGLQAGNYVYELTVTDDDGDSGTDSVMISVVNNFRYVESLNIYPNPVDVKARIRCVSDSTGELLIRVLDAHGRVVKVMNSFKGQSDFEQDILFTELRPGIYYLEAIIGNKKRMIKQFIKR
ncbi:MAG TPA: PKD domain-containing protein [Chitinophagaceae bacterium]|nr:PKD domain-containing protein [Chitinophagaceae bacterium]